MKETRCRTYALPHAPVDVLHSLPNGRGTAIRECLNRHSDLHLNHGENDRPRTPKWIRITRSWVALYAQILTGRRTVGDEAILVYDPSIQIFDTQVYLFNPRTERIDQFDRVHTRDTIRKVITPSEQQSAIAAYLRWIDTDAGSLFIRLVQQIQNQPRIPDYLHQYYRVGYQDGYTGYRERVFDSITPEICRREYNRGYIDGAEDSDLEQRFSFASEPDDVDESYSYDSHPDLEAIEDHRQQIIEDEQVYRSKLKYDDYAQYLKGERWLLVKIGALIRANFQCQSCGSQKHPEVHHKTYIRCGEELPEDLAVLCDRCHGRIHRGQP